MASTNKIKTMVNGLPGKMASKVAEYLSKNEYFELLPLSLTGPEIEQEEVDIGNIKIELIKPRYRDKISQNTLSDFSCQDWIAVDFTHPSAVNPNAEFYCNNNLNFVMGTTGGDKKLIENTVKTSRICSVIAPNMAKQIVAFQAMMEHAAATFPDVFKGYRLKIKESHQKGKADTSGTAKAMVGYFNKLGIPFTPDQIVMVREPEEQIKIGISEKDLGGHGWHTYTLQSEDGTVLFEFTHNVNGRDVYALGTLDAIRYLNRKVKEGNRGVSYSMIDVLKGK